MKQIITGPMGRVAYHGTSGQNRGQYPALNLPCLKFARAINANTANSNKAPGVTELPRHMRSRAALAMFGSPAKRGS
jgi:hypothetical protein